MLPVVHADVEKWLGRWIRDRKDALTAGLPVELTWVSNTDRPRDQGGRPDHDELHVIIRNDSGSRRALLLKDVAVGLTVLGHSRRDQAAIRQFAERLVATIVAAAPLDPASPVADVPAANGPYTVRSDNDEARLYATVSLTLVGTHI